MVRITGYEFPGVGSNFQKGYSGNCNGGLHFLCQHKTNNNTYALVTGYI